MRSIPFLRRLWFVREGVYPKLQYDVSPYTLIAPMDRLYFLFVSRSHLRHRVLLGDEGAVCVYEATRSGSFQDGASGRDFADGPDSEDRL